jgi:hypothetical protein
VYEDMTINDAFREAMQFIEQIFQEKVIVGIKTIEGQWKGSVSFSPETLIETLPFRPTYIRSWLGTYDASFEE